MPPLKQGLRLNKIRFSIKILFVIDQLPVEQGLRRIYVFNTNIIKSFVRDQLPLKQGLNCTDAMHCVCYYTRNRRSSRTRINFKLPINNYELQIGKSASDIGQQASGKQIRYLTPFDMTRDIHSTVET